MGTRETTNLAVSHPVIVFDLLTSILYRQGSNKKGRLMKGLVFTTFYDFCESHYGPETLEEVIEGARLPHSGAYTSVGTYPFEEMAALVSALVEREKRTMPSILEQFGEYCFERWVSKFPTLFADRDIFDVLASIDSFHEAEVRKLYPDAELPSFCVVNRSGSELTLDYKSCKPLADLAVGVIKGAAKHLGSPVDVHYANQNGGIRFSVKRSAFRQLVA